MAEKKGSLRKSPSTLGLNQKSRTYGLSAVPLRWWVIKKKPHIQSLQDTRIPVPYFPILKPNTSKNGWKPSSFSTAGASNQNSTWSHQSLRVQRPMIWVLLSLNPLSYNIESILRKFNWMGRRKVTEGRPCSCFGSILVVFNSIVVRSTEKRVQLYFLHVVFGKHLLCFGQLEISFIVGFHLFHLVETDG